MNAFTLRDVAVALHHKHDVTTAFAEEALETYIEQVESLDGPTIDQDEITEDDADFLMGAFASAQRAGDFGERELAQVEDLARELAAATEVAESLRHQRDTAIRTALLHGARVTDTMAAGDVSRARVDQIRKGTR